MSEPIILSRAYHPIDPIKIEKIVLEVLEKNKRVFDNKEGYVIEAIVTFDFPNVAREVAERITNENRR